MATSAVISPLSAEETQFKLFTATENVMIAKWSVFASIAHAVVHRVTKISRKIAGTFHFL
jgi:hypothetical protein